MDPDDQGRASHSNDSNRIFNEGTLASIPERNLCFIFLNQIEPPFLVALEVDNDKISAVMADGVLRVDLPKSKAAKARTITVE